VSVEESGHPRARDLRDPGVRALALADAAEASIRLGHSSSGVNLFQRAFRIEPASKELVERAAAALQTLSVVYARRPPTRVRQQGIDHLLALVDAAAKRRSRTKGTRGPTSSLGASSAPSPGPRAVSPR
jgi:hypothetical protein